MDNCNIIQFYNIQVRGFFFSLLWCRNTGNHPQEDLVRFGYRTGRTSKNILQSCCCLATWKLHFDEIPHQNKTVIQVSRQLTWPNIGPTPAIWKKSHWMVSHLRRGSCDRNFPVFWARYRRIAPLSKTVSGFPSAKIFPTKMYQNWYCVKMECTQQPLTKQVMRRKMSMTKRIVSKYQKAHLDHQDP
jgi:hypothetical protein